MSRLWRLGFVGIALAAGLLAQCAEDHGPEPGLVIVPGSPTLEVSSSQAFGVDLDGSAPVVNWYVDGVRGGTPATGMVSKSGIYVAPAEVPAGGVVTLTAKVAEDTTVEGAAEIEIIKSAESVYITLAPDTATVMAGHDIEFGSTVFGCSSDSVTWSLLRTWGGVLNIGGIDDDGVYHAPPTPGSSFGLMVMAQSATCEDKTGIARLVIHVPPTEFSVELEQFTDRLNIGGIGIAASYCGGASGGKQVIGLDVATEWIKVPISVPVTGTYEVHLRYQATGDSPVYEALAIEGQGDPPPEAAFSLMQGSGIG
jgi:hypothetical protein